MKEKILACAICDSGFVDGESWKRPPHPPFFVSVDVKGFSGKGLVSVDVKGVADAMFVSVDVKALSCILLVL